MLGMGLASRLFGVFAERKPVIGMRTSLNYQFGPLAGDFAGSLLNIARLFPISCSEKQNAAVNDKRQQIPVRMYRHTVKVSVP
jgi:hypothetical protein